MPMRAVRDYDSTVARIAGNLLSGCDVKIGDQSRAELAQAAVRLARAIVAEARRTEPDDPADPERPF